MGQREAPWELLLVLLMLAASKAARAAAAAGGRQGGADAGLLCRSNRREPHRA